MHNNCTPLYKYTVVKTVNYVRINGVSTQKNKKKFKRSHYTLITILTFALILFRLIPIRLAH